MIDLLIFFVGAWAGAQNALAGGGSFLILPTLMLAGLDARAANVTSCVALFPAQIATGWTGRALAAGANGLSLKTLFAISVVGGAVGAVVLLITPSAFFGRLLPWLVLFATLIFAWGSFFRKKTETPRRLSLRAEAAVQFLISIYGGYFGGGIGFMMMAALTLAGQNARVAGATKNVLAGVINAAAVAIFLFAPDLHWRQAVMTSAGAILGGVLGAKMLHHIDEKLLRVFVVIIGAALTIGLFYRAA
jgi:uncharacterized protein